MGKMKVVTRTGEGVPHAIAALIEARDLWPDGSAEWEHLQEAIVILTRAFAGR